MAEGIRPSDEVVQANIKKWGIPQPEREYTVLIHCTTYNHGKYIKNALEGFVMQKCSYSFCAIIIDDCSTDNNAEIIREYAEKYPDIIKPILLGENHMQRGILRDPYFEKWHKCAKYLAQCEGDDYWIDPLKLQKQVDFLETHPDYGLVHSYYKYVDEFNNPVLNPSPLYANMRERIIDDYIWGYYLRHSGFILTCTTCIRLSCLTGERNFFDRGSFMSVARISKVFCIKDELAAYRRNPRGAMMTSANNEMYYKTVSVLLYQIYYYHKNGHCPYYDKDNETQTGIGESAIVILAFWIKRRFPHEDNSIIRFVLRKELYNMLRCAPKFLIKKIKKI